MPLLLGVAREVITPNIGEYLFGYNDHTKSHSVHDDLTATAMIIRSGSTMVLFLSVTVCLVHDKICKEIREKAGFATGVPAWNVIICPSHTHSGPRTTSFDQFTTFGSLDEAYCNDIFIPKCVSAAKLAASEMNPVLVGVGTTESLVGINRRQLMEDNKVILGQNPWDPYDSTMTVISFVNSDKKPVANVIHVGAHCTAAGNNHEITRDWAGVMTDRLETESGALTLFMNGTLGDVAPRMANGDSVGDLKHAMEVGGLAGIDAVRCFKQILTFYDEPLISASADLQVPFLPLMPKEEVFSRIKVCSENEGHRFEKASLECLADMYKSGDMGPDEWIFHQTVIRLGPVVWVPFPFEVSSEIGLRLRSYSQYAHTLTLSCTNGSHSYLPAQNQICRGGYEIDSFRWFRPRQLPDDVDQRLIDQNLNIIDQLRG